MDTGIWATWYNLADDSRDFACQPARERILVEWPALGSREHELPQFFGSGQRTRVRGENAIALHVYCVLLPREFRCTRVSLSTPVTGRIAAWQ